MTEQQAPQPPDKKDGQSWLRRQWANLRAGRWRDVIIANVEDGAENVAVGKNIFQINVGGHNITPYLLVIMLAVLVLVGYFFYPRVEPLWNPSRMGGTNSIAIANFGLMKPNGSIGRSDFGEVLSELVFDQLREEYAQIEDEGVFDGNVSIWHDNQTHEEKNVRFGVIKGKTAEERSEAADKLARRIDADLVIYGYLTDEEDPEGLVLEFYYRSPTISSEPDAIVGNHRLGQAVPAEFGLYNIDPTLAKNKVTSPLSDRTRAIFYLTLGLTYGLANNHEEALATFQRAEAELTEWEDEDGKAVLYYFMGRSALLSRQHDVANSALEDALEINPDYVNALITLGAVYIDRAQLFFVRDRELPPAIADCIPASGYEHSSPTLEDAIVDIETGLAYLDQAVDQAPETLTPPLKQMAQMTRAIGRNLRGQAAIFAGDMAEARRSVSAAQEDFDAIVDPFAQAEQPRYVAWTHLGNGAAHLLEGHLHVSAAVDAANAGNAEIAESERAEAVEALEQAGAHFDACIATEGDTIVADQLFQKFILGCGCEPYREQAQMTLDEQLQLLD
jgi:tetratricopeptide (TPR) repeat protein